MKLRILLLATILLTSLSITAQRTVTPTELVTVQGKVTKEKTFTLTALDTFPKVAIKDQTLYNHKGEEKGTVKNMKGIPLKKLLASIEFTYEKPKELNEFYFVFTASDGYKVVFSWNEIYNTEAGNNFYIVTEMDGKPLKDMEQRILFISTSDLKAGRRYIKGLQRIEVKRVE
ncbi:molybdopterin-binding protein [Flavobacterium sp.]|uniref:molybdopterin-binding protein n=1 Tax=Flavobacterium sp. TaxID=239 RepID=UPI002FD8D493